MGEQQYSTATDELVEAARNGDNDACGRVLERFRPRLEVVIHLRMGAWLRALVDPEEVYQETCLRAITSLKSFEWRSEASFFRWLGAIAENVIRNLVRYYRTHPTVSLTELLSSGSDHPGVLQLPGSAVTPPEAMRRRDRFDRLEAALDRLKVDHREVIILARIRGLRIKQVAKRMQRTPDATSMLLLRALRELRKHFGSTASFSLPAASLDPPSAEG